MAKLQIKGKYALELAAAYTKKQDKMLKIDTSMKIELP